MEVPSAFVQEETIEQLPFTANYAAQCCQFSFGHTRSSGSVD